MAGGILVIGLGKLMPPPPGSVGVGQASGCCASPEAVKNAAPIPKISTSPSLLLEYRRWHDMIRFHKGCDESLASASTRGIIPPVPVVSDLRLLKVEQERQVVTKK